MGRGNNHRHDCGCGWCTSTWTGGRIDRGDVGRNFAYQDARRVLREFRAGDVRAKCFVNPNAQCPVCGAAVFYYQNAFGSRVYFNQLGPPWPKHSCTNIPKLQPHGTSIQRPAARGRGERIELIEAARHVGKYEEVRFANGGYPIDWQMIEIIELNRKGDKIFTVGRLLQQIPDDHLVNLSVDDQGGSLEIGDVVSACFSHVSFFDMTSFSVRSLPIHWYRDNGFSLPIKVADHVINDVPDVAPQISTDSQRIRGGVTLIRRAHAPAWLKRSGAKHRGKPNTLKRKSKKKVTSSQVSPALLAPTASIQASPETGMDREKMLELLSSRFKISLRKDN